LIIKSFYGILKFFSVSKRLVIDSCVTSALILDVLEVAIEFIDASTLIPSHEVKDDLFLCRLILSIWIRKVKQSRCLSHDYWCSFVIEIYSFLIDGIQIVSRKTQSLELFHCLFAFGHLMHCESSLMKLANASTCALKKRSKYSFFRVRNLKKAVAFRPISFDKRSDRSIKIIVLFGCRFL